MKVYISGKIGEEVISEATRQKFAKAEEMLKAKGYEVFNPTCEEWQKNIILGYGVDVQQAPPPKDGKISKYAYILLRDQMALANKDAILMLEDWQDSPGATSEYYFAMATGKKIFFASREHAVLRLEEDWKEANKTMKMRAPRYKYVDLHLHESWLPIN